MSAVPNLAAGPSGGPSRSAVALPHGRRGVELAMLGFAIAIMAFAYIAAGLGLNGHAPSGLITYVVGFAVLMGIGHLTVRRFAKWADPLLLPLAALLNGLGIVMIYRLQESGRRGNSGYQITTLTTHAALYQLMWTAVGMAAFVAVLVVIREPRVLQRYTYTLGTVGLFLLAIPAVLPSRFSAVQGAGVDQRRRASRSSPASSPRSTLAVFFASYLVRKRDVLSLAGRRLLGIDLPRGRDMGPIIVLWAVAMLILILETTSGPRACSSACSSSMLYVATQRKSWLLIGMLSFVGGALRRLSRSRTSMNGSRSG